MSSFDDIIKYVAIIALVMLSATFSGLTLGLLSLDKIGLQIVMSGEDKVLAGYAERIAPIRENGNLLLCTLLLGNVAVNAYLSILMADLTSGTMGFILSTVLIVLFGEIIPQASCSRYALQIGSRAVPLVKLLVILMYPITYFLALALDKVLGDELGTIHTRTELTELLRIHVAHGAMDVEQGQISQGAITYVDKKVSAVMSDFADAYLLNASDLLDFRKITEIFKSGYSRIPVYEKDKHDIIGILLVKDLIFVDPDDNTIVRNFIQIFGRNFHLLWPDDKLGDVLRLFKTGKSHMAIVRDVNNDGPGDPFYEVKGIVTLEDIVEEILGDEIKDETDLDTNLGASDAFDYSKLRLLDSGKLEYDKLTPAESLAIGAHFMRNVKPFSELDTEVLEKVSVCLPNSEPVLIVGNDNTSSLQSPAPGTIEMGVILPTLNGVHGYGTHQKTKTAKTPAFMDYLLEGCPVLELVRQTEDDDVEREGSDLFYKRGEPADYMIMVLTGKVMVLAGKDGFRSEAGPWSVIGTDSLKVNLSDHNGNVTTYAKDSETDSSFEETFIPDFSAYINSPILRYIKITRSNYKQALSGKFAFKIGTSKVAGAVFKESGGTGSKSSSRRPSAEVFKSGRMRTDSSSSSASNASASGSAANSTHTNMNNMEISNVLSVPRKDSALIIMESVIESPAQSPTTKMSDSVHIKSGGGTTGYSALPANANMPKSKPASKVEDEESGHLLGDSN